MNQYTNKYTEEDFERKCNELNVIYNGTSKEKKKGTMIHFICPIHSDKGEQIKDWSHFKNLKQACSYCAGRNLTTSDANKLILNPNIEFVSEYQGVEKPVQCHCKKCGAVWVTNRPLDLFRRECGCPVCAKENRRKKRLKPHEEYVKEVEDKFPNIKIIGDYIGTHNYIRCYCNIHKIEWESIACNILNGAAGCPICNCSVGERNVIQYLNKMGYKYVQQKSFEDCRDILPLKYDVYDIDNNVLIEFQGEQHYYPVDFDTNDPQKAETAFEALKRRDQIKEDYCSANNIPLIKIPYWERNNVEQFLDQKYKEIKVA